MCQQFVKSLPGMSLGEMVGQGKWVGTPKVWKWHGHVWAWLHNPSV